MVKQLYTWHRITLVLDTMQIEPILICLMLPKVAKARTASPATESIGGISEKMTISIQLIYLLVILKLAILLKYLWQRLYLYSPFLLGYHGRLDANYDWFNLCCVACSQVKQRHFRCHKHFREKTLPLYM